MKIEERDVRSTRGKWVQRCAALVFVGVVCVGVVLAASPRVRWGVWSVFTGVRGRATVAERVAQYGEAARGRLKSGFDAAGVAYPAGCLVLVAFKEEKRLELWGAAVDGAAGDAGAQGSGVDAGSTAARLKKIKEYPILAASGVAGPKVREGDRQVPEGFYRVESLNPNSMYHLALRLDYPNAEDVRVAQTEGRDVRSLGGDIMVHGKAASIGCLAMGDEAIEELFIAAAETGHTRVEVVILPRDPRGGRGLPEDEQRRAWVKERYAKLAEWVERLE